MFLGCYWYYRCTDVHTLWRTKWQSALRYGWDDTEIKPLLTFWLKSVSFFFYYLFQQTVSGITQKFTDSMVLLYPTGKLWPNKLSEHSLLNLLLFLTSDREASALQRLDSGRKREISVRKLISSVYYNLKFFHILLLVMYFSWHTKGTKWKLAYLSITLSVEITGIKNLFTHRAVRSWSSPWLCFLPAQERCKSNLAAVWAEVNVWERWFLLGVICFQPLLIPRNSPSTQLKVDYAHSWIMKVFDWNLLTAFMANLISRETVQAVMLIQATRVDSSTLITL